MKELSNPYMMGQDIYLIMRQNAFSMGPGQIMRRFGLFKYKFRFVV
jgi:hypothetical protein